MYRYRELAGGRRFRCEKCGRLKRVKYVPESNLCRQCALKEARLRNPNIPIQLADNLIVTKAVEKNISKQAYREIPPSKSENIGEAISFWSILVTFPSAYFIAKAISQEPKFYFWLGPACLAQLILMNVIDRFLAKPRKERKDKIARRVVEIAEIRKKAYEEAFRFYSSPEWIALRKRVIQEEGRVCADCGKQIKNDVDVTVDHKFPRSKYGNLELDRKNLRVLCRKCNSKKGARLLDW